MHIDFLDNVSNIEDRIIHIIEHEGYGTLHQLIEPLQEDFEQKVICTHNLVNMKFIRKNVHYIIHTTGHLYPIISNLKLLLDNGVDVSIFLHVAPRYFYFKEKNVFLDYICNIQRIYNLQCFCPANELTIQYKKAGLHVKSIQLGFSEINVDLNSNNFLLDTYCGKYITVCTSSDPRYIDLKGINEFVDIMEKIDKKEEALIFGFDGNYRGVKCKRLNLNDFLYVLKNSNAYIQLSKTEAYNLTAVQAKRLKVPVLVSDIDGHKDCMKYIDNRLKNEQDFSEKLKLACNIECIDRNYEDSNKRETLDNFIIAIKNTIKGVKSYE